MRTFPLIAVSTIVLLSAGAASAQSLIPSAGFDAPDIFGREKNTSVLERPRPDYQAAGINLGGFTLFPKIELDSQYSDNIYASSGSATAFFPRVSDVFFSIRPSVDVNSNWGRHSLTFHADLNNTDYVKYSSENTTSWDVRSNARIDIHGDSHLDLGVDADHGYEARGSESTQADAAHPVGYYAQTLFGRGIYAQDRVRASLELLATNYTYDNVSAVDSTGKVTGTLDEQSRDYIYSTAIGRVDYALTPDEALFVQFQPDDIRYQRSVLGLPQRNSTGFRGLIGATFDITSVARGEIGVGYINREYASSTYTNISGLAFAAKVDYFPTQLLTLTLAGARQVQDASFATASGGYFQNTVNVEGDYELRRNVVVSAEAGFERDDFSGINRNDTIWNVQGKARYYLTRAVGVGLTVSHLDRTSSGAPAFLGPKYNENRVGLSLVFQR